MAAPWAQAFYRGPAWKRCRKAYLASRHYRCERCGKPAQTVHHRQHLTPVTINNPSMALGWWNLEAVCRDCHGREHHGKAVEATREGFAFDENGDLVRRDDA